MHGCMCFRSSLHFSANDLKLVVYGLVNTVERVQIYFDRYKYYLSKHILKKCYMQNKSSIYQVKTYSKGYTIAIAIKICIYNYLLIGTDSINF